MNKEFYVILTGSKNNAGDYLIKYRAKKLFGELRPDRDIVDLNAWQPFDKKALDLVNSSKALILMGGPALQSNMYPGIYPLTTNLDEIKVPIVTMGIGWKSISGKWTDTYSYSMSESTLALLRRIESSGFNSSVRDYHTLNALRKAGISNFVMTGCPALYDTEQLKTSDLEESLIESVAFSLGVSFLESSGMEKQMKELILNTKAMFAGKRFVVAFHHSLAEKFLQTHNATDHHLNGHRKFAKWLTENNIEYEDISGSAQNLINFYDNFDFHIGYRVHAHIYMNSKGKRSVLISEDGRATGLNTVISGMIFEGAEYSNHILRKLAKKIVDCSRYTAEEGLVEDVLNNISYEIENTYPRMKSSQSLIKANYEVMRDFLLQLP